MRAQPEWDGICFRCAKPHTDGHGWVGVEGERGRTRPEPVADRHVPRGGKLGSALSRLHSRDTHVHGTLPVGLQRDENVLVTGEKGYVVPCFTDDWTV